VGRDRGTGENESNCPDNASGPMETAGPGDDIAARRAILAIRTVGGQRWRKAGRRKEPSHSRKAGFPDQNF